MTDKFQWKAKREKKAFLALADGAVFHGYAFGAKTDTVGEAVFNTGMAGYKQIITDPSYAGQFVVFTTAEVGAYTPCQPGQSRCSCPGKGNGSRW